MRLHLGLNEPVGEYSIAVGIDKEKWIEGDIIMFDDTIIHSARNKTEFSRMIVIVDVYRKSLK